MRKDYVNVFYPPKIKRSSVDITPLVMMLVFVVILFAEPIGNWLCTILGF